MLRKVYDALKYCPECGRELDTESENMDGTFQRACILHGDFFIRDNKIVWENFPYPLPFFLKGE